MLRMCLCAWNAASAAFISELKALGLQMWSYIDVYWIMERVSEVIIEFKLVRSWMLEGKALVCSGARNLRVQSQLTDVRASHQLGTNIQKGARDTTSINRIFSIKNNNKSIYCKIYVCNHSWLMFKPAASLEQIFERAPRPHPSIIGYFQ